ncbi:LANO_0B00518g1_1 [Lachancea nothofagi CBS 11611]|uniref:LANO_0B00518g1_1 n=1 Tax=Lachancea nothofagi CBS 11611 TaxID=1266666 RepID=A0A1G4IU79_9SACH|nr:LANO_0B00518g1_1 [Lachancea nothofagi CBS 11611]
MFRAGLKAGLRAYSNQTKRFVTNRPSRSNKWVPWAIFGTSFGLGWFVTQHMTFADLLAKYMFDNVPENDEGLMKYKAQMQQRLENLSVVKQLKQVGYTEVFSQRKKNNTLIDKTLQVPGGITIPPRFFYNPKTKETVGIYHLGMKLTGYPFLVHGGVLATVMEDLMRESVMFAQGAKSEKTQDLTLNYKFPTFANQFVVVRITQVEENGKNVKLHAELMDQSGDRTLVKGTGRFKT